MGDNYKIEIRQKKTRDRLSNPLSPEILHWLPERSDEASSSDIVFPLVAEQYVNDKIREIAKEAGIHKHLFFHSASHNKIFYWLSINELRITKKITANDLETSYILFLSQLCNIQRTLWF